MSATYQAIGWNADKKLYDRVLVAFVVAYLALFCGVTLIRDPEITTETLILRAFGTLGLLLLHVVLVIGPLCRLDRRFLPLLYNRRHLGVTMFLCALVHGLLALVQFHALGDLPILVNVLAGNPQFTSVSQFPFQVLGLIALLILFLMAATSHDFWLANLTAPVWKALHMAVYLAYGLIVLHVAFGILQDERRPLLVILLTLGFLTIVSLHLVAAWRERAADRPSALRVPAEDPFVPVCAVDEIPEKRARTAFLAGERVAIFSYDGQISAVSALCQHQNGPLGEGKILDGCIVCPWHGYQYRPHDGSSPPPFTEKLPTFRVAVRDGRVYVDPRPLAPGTAVVPVRCAEACHENA